MDKISVGIVGSTGMIGEKLLQLLSSHPIFTLSTLIGSEARKGQKLQDVVDSSISHTIDPAFLEIPFSSLEEVHNAPLIFSCVTNDKAHFIEDTLAKRGHGIISSAKAHRFSPYVPILIPEVNPHHLEWIEKQPYNGGFIITKPNCSVVGITIALKPLMDAFGLKDVHITTLQSLSGAGKKGLFALDMIDNIIPYIEGEEEKIEEEPRKILDDQQLNISSTATRVPISYGHMAVVSISLKKKVSPQSIIDVWNNYRAPLPLLPSLSSQLIQYLEAKDQPQPKNWIQREKGMGVTIGRLKPCSHFDYTFIVVSHNLLRGGAGGSLLTAEFLASIQKLQMQAQTSK